MMGLKSFNDELYAIFVLKAEKNLEVKKRWRNHPGWNPG